MKTTTVYTATLNETAANKEAESAFRTWDAANDTAYNVADRSEGSFETFDELRKLAKAMLNCTMLKAEALDADHAARVAIETRQTAQLVYTAAMAIVDSWDSERRHGAGFKTDVAVARASVACARLNDTQIGDALKLAEGYGTKA
jgi:hypothetical protein